MNDIGLEFSIFLYMSTGLKYADHKPCIRGKIPTEKNVISIPLNGI